LIWTKACRNPTIAHPIYEAANTEAKRLVGVTPIGDELYQSK
jgi:hypothetical protein